MLLSFPQVRIELENDTFFITHRTRIDFTFFKIWQNLDSSYNIPSRSTQKKRRIFNHNVCFHKNSFFLIIERSEHFREKRAIVKIESQMTKSHQYTWTCSSFECRTFCWKTKFLPWKFGACSYSKKRFCWKTIFLPLKWGAFLHVFAHFGFQSYLRKSQKHAGRFTGWCAG